MKKLFLISTLILITTLSYKSANSEYKNEFAKLVQGKICIIDQYEVFTFDNNGNIIGNDGTIRYYFDSTKSSNEFLFYFTGGYNYYTGEYDNEIKNYTGYIISNNVLREMTHSYPPDGEGDPIYINNKEELERLYNEKGSYVFGLLFDKNEYNKIKNQVKKYKYEDFFATFESEDKKNFITLSEPKDVKELDNKKVYSMYSVYIDGNEYITNINYHNGAEIYNYGGDYYYGYNGVVYDEGFIFNIINMETEIYDEDFFHIIIIDKNNLFMISNSFSGFLKRKN